MIWKFKIILILSSLSFLKTFPRQVLSIFSLERNKKGTISFLFLFLNFRRSVPASFLKKGMRSFITCKVVVPLFCMIWNTNMNWSYKYWYENLKAFSCYLASHFWKLILVKFYQIFRLKGTKKEQFPSFFSIP